MFWVWRFLKPESRLLIRQFLKAMKIGLNLMGRLLLNSFFIIKVLKIESLYVVMVKQDFIEISFLIQTGRQIILRLN